MKAGVTFEILCLVLIASLNQYVAAQSLLGLDLHKQSQHRARQRAEELVIKSKPVNIYHSNEPQDPASKSLRFKRHSHFTQRTQRAGQRRADLVASSSDEPAAFDSVWTAHPSDFQAASSPETTTTTATSTDLQTPSDISTQQAQTIQHQAAVAKETATTTSTTTTTTTKSPASESSYELTSAELCYLSSGGSSLTLAVNEATQVGATIGTLDVNGDPSLEGGNVDLQVEGEGQQQVGGGGGGGELTAGRFMQTTSTAASLSASASSRQMRRLLGRRDTSELGALQHQAGGFTSQTAALRLEPGTKDLILARPLDKESAEGESGLVVNVRCRARAPDSLAGQTKQWARFQATTIPIRLIITDANDHAPEFVGAQPYVINISETTAPNTPLAGSRDILALDRDAAGPHSTIHYQVVEQSGAALAAGFSSAAVGGQQHAAQPLSRERAANFSKLSHLFAFANPLEPVLWLTGALDYETLPAPSFTITILAHDQAEPEALQSKAQVQINVLDFDDQNPKFLDEKYTLVMDEQQSNLVGQNLRVLPRNLRAEDGDRVIMAPILYSFESPQAAGSSALLGAPDRRLEEGANELLDNIDSYLHLNPASGELRLIRKWPTGAWGPLTLVVRATQADNRDRYALTTLTIVRAASAAAAAAAAATGEQRASRPHGAEQRASQGIAFLQDKVLVQVPEDAAINEKLVRVRAQHLNASSALVATATGADSSDNQQVDLIVGSQQQRQQQPDSSGAAATASQQRQGGWPLAPDNKRPISYQILDDQMDQFGINAQAELFLKRPLDYEQRQEFKLRVLATYGKYSDICQVHLQVLNVNDNKPKFTQAHYSFHLTESRLRSNLIGSLQAHDADLNDTLSYSISSGQSKQEQQCAKLFEFADPTAGRLSLRVGIRQLNVSQCQLVAEASDSLGPPSGRHFQQARVSIHVAPQIVGRAINLAEERWSSVAPEEEAKLFHSRAVSTSNQELALAAESAQKNAGQRARGQVLHLKPSSRGDDSQQRAESATSSNVLVVQYEPTTSGGHSSQRSSLATVMASLQHMVKSVNFFEMPMSSALLLSVLLAFLVCLLLIVVISMSVHVYRRRSKTRRRRHLTAAAHLRHAQLAATGNAGLISAYKAPSNSTSSYTATTSTSPASSSSSSSSPSSSILNSARGQQQLPNGKKNSNGRVKNNSTNIIKNNENNKSGKQNYFDNLALCASVTAITSSQSTGDEANANANANTNDTSLTSASSANSNAQQPVGALGKPLEELKISTELENSENRSTTNATYLKSAPSGEQKRPAHSFVSSLTVSSLNQSAQNSYFGVGSSSVLSTDEDSSVIQCGHYSVNGTIEHDHKRTSQNLSRSKLGEQEEEKRLAGAANKGQQQIGWESDRIEAAQRINTSRLLEEINCELAKQQKRQQAAKASEPNTRQPLQHPNKASQTKSSIEAAIRSLVRRDQEATESGQENNSATQRAERSSGRTQTGNNNNNNKFMIINCDESEVSELTSSGKPGIKSYRRLPLMNSLVRPMRSQMSSLASGAKVAPLEQAPTRFGDECGLMALVRDSSNKSQLEPQHENQAQQQPQQISWPRGAIPQRTKRLTWDDELSCCQDDEPLEADRWRRQEAELEVDCYIAPDIQLAGPITPLGLEHHYSSPTQPPIEYLYSPSSQMNVPRPNYGYYLPLLNGHSREQAALGVQDSRLQFQQL